MRLLLKLLIIVLVTLDGAIANEREMLVEQLASARLEKRLAPVISLKMGAALNEELAYQLQTDVNRHLLKTNKPAGFKAGLTTLAAQKKFAVTGPVAGVLLEQPLKAEDSPILSLNDYHRMMIEVELGFRFKHTLKTPVSDVAALKALVASVLPVIEIPDLGFDQPKQLKGVDIVANNVIAKAFIVGKPSSTEQLDINQIKTRLYRNKLALFTAESGEVMNDQWQALLWLVNRMIENGWHIEPGQVLITGAIGKMIPAKVGLYHAEFGALGTIEFTVSH